MAPPLLQLDDIHLTFGGTPLLRGASLVAGAGDRIALVGRNGSGKSTLLRIAAGLVEPQSGTVFRQPDATVRYLEQDPDPGGHATIGAWVAAELGPADDPHRAEYLLRQLGLDPEAAPSGLSGGEARRAALARVLAPSPDILLLDEPTNHLDIAAIEWLEEELARMRAAIVVISHDRRFLENLSRTTVWLDRGVTQRLPRGFAHFEAWRDEMLEQERRDADKLARRIAAEEDWVRYGVTARRKRNVRRLAELRSMREAYRNRDLPQGAAALAASEGRDSGRLVIEAERIGKSWDGRTVVRDFSIRIRRGDRIGIVGPNGAGKTTLLKLLIGEIEPDAGRIRHGANLQLAVFDQRRTSLQPDLTLQEYLAGGSDQIRVGGGYRHVVSWLKDHLFLPEQARTPVRELSGGERARLVLSKIFAEESNVLVLDEPTNDLDMETLDLLEEIVASYAGTVLLVSHDRDFLDRTVTSTIAPGEDGRWHIYAGGWSDMQAQRRLADGKDAAVKEKSARPVRPASGPRPVPEARPRKLSFEQKFALEKLPGEIEAVRREIAALEARMADPALYSSDAAAFGRLAAQLEEKRADLERMEEEWLELEILREELES
jgi:ATP-binding cassette subfamily F protein uup